MSSHPAYAEEQKRLKQTEGVIESLLISEREEAKETKAKLMEAFKYKRDDANALYIAQVLYDRAEQQVKNLTAAGLVPYFTRIDFTEKDGDSFRYYIGKHGVMRPNSFDMEVVDWRSPVANLYYSGQVGPMHYKAPDGEIEGELTLKRQIGIENGELMSIFDTDVVSQEKYLQDVLGEAKGDRLRDIVTTIQAEQNFVIRYDLKKNLVVQGVAGSGKTTIALHRIAYLLYSFQDTLYPEQVAILAPNPLFLNFIAGVLPDLGVERVRQTTYYSFVYDCFDEKVPLLIPKDRTAELLAMEPEERQKRMRILSDKGSLSFAERLEKFLHLLEEEQPPKEDLRFGPVTLFTAAEMHQMFTVDKRRIPLLKRREEFQEYLKVRVADAAKQVCDWLESETAKRASFMRSTLPEGTDKQMRMRKLYDSRDQRIAETKKRASTYPNTVMEGLTEYQPLEVYRRFLEAEADETAEYTLKNL